jgi:hypothetical protein
MMLDEIMPHIHKLHNKARAEAAQDGQEAVELVDAAFTVGKFVIGLLDKIERHLADK